MKFSCGREILTRKLQMAQRATDVKSNIAVLRNVLFTLAENTLELTGFDHRIGIKTSLECVTEEPGEITVPCALLLEILGVMKGDSVHFNLDGFVMNIESGRQKYNINCMSAEDFPPFPEIQENKSFNQEADILEDGIRKTYFATNPDDPRAFMGGVLMSSSGGKLLYVGTDGHRLAFREFETGDKLPEFEVVVPTRTLGEVLRIISETDAEKVEIIAGDKTISFNAGDVFMVSRLVEVKFPNFSKVIPQNTEGSCRVSRRNFADAVRGASIMARAKENKDMIEINITDESIRLYSSTQDMGSATEEIEVVKKGNDIRVAFNSRYIIDFLGVVEDDEVVIDYVDELKPGLFHTDDPGYKYVLMPIQV